MLNFMEDKISKEKLEKYKRITSKALCMAKKNVARGMEKAGEEIIEMVENYVSDAEHFELKGRVVDAFAALNYAHGWLDCGARLKIFDVHDNKLFTVV